MSKTVFLIVYLWHATNHRADYNQGGTGGPAISIHKMPSLAACEAVGKAAKELTDSKGPTASIEPEAFHSAPTVYRCIEVSN